VLSELGLAALAALIWAHTAPGAVNALAYNVIFVASVSTLLFNLNPLMRFDGYHMMVDLLDVPNVFQRSREQLRYLAERFLFRLPTARPAARTPTESVMLPLYGVASLAYWIVLMVSIIVFIASQYLDFGVLLAWLLGIMTVVVPLVKFVKYLGTSPRLTHHRGRAVGVTLACAVTAAGLLAGVPAPDRVRAAGVVEAAAYRQVNAESAGYVAEMLAPPGSAVRRGQPLIRLVHAELEVDLRAARLQREQLLAQELRAQSVAIPDLAPLRRQREAVEALITELQRQVGALTIVAPIDGVWSASPGDLALGRWVARGATLGSVVDTSEWRFVAVLPQVSTHLFDSEVRSVEVRLRGQEHLNVVAERVQVVPFETGTLPSRALGFAGGGDIAVSPQDPQGLTAAEPFFRIHAQLPLQGPEMPSLLHGRLGTMRLTLQDRPLAQQLERSVRQFLQRRFRV
jgi:putative peptide zinc metalloprotease protein